MLFCVEKNEIPLNVIEYKLLNSYPEDDDKTTNIYLSSFSEELKPVVQKIVNEANKNKHSMKE